MKKELYKFKIISLLFIILIGAISGCKKDEENDKSTLNYNGNSYDIPYGYVWYNDGGLSEVLLMDSELNYDDETDNSDTWIYLNLYNSIEGTVLKNGTYQGEDLNVEGFYIKDEGINDFSGLNGSSANTVTVSSSGGIYDIDFTLIFEDGYEISGNYHGSITALEPYEY